MHLECDEVRRTDCPVCGGKNTFTATNRAGDVLYNCYKAGCSVRGAHQTKLTVDQVVNRLQKNKQVNDTDFVMPRYITRSTKVGLFAEGTPRTRGRKPARMNSGSPEIKQKR